MVDTSPLQGRTLPELSSSGIDAQLPNNGSQTCMPKDDRNVEGRAMYAISARTGIIGVSCSLDKDQNALFVYVGPARY